VSGDTRRIDQTNNHGFSKGEMKTMKARNLFLVLVLLAAMGAFFGATQASSIQEISPRAFGMFGITQGQTARLSMVSLETGELLPAIQVELSFIDSDGNTLLQKVHTLHQGKAVALDLNGNLFAGRGRTQIRALVRFIGTPDTRDDPFFRNCLPTMEVVDNTTGRTSFIVPVRDDPFFRTSSIGLDGAPAQKVNPAN
jgi:hypothetical protein